MPENDQTDAGSGDAGAGDAGTGTGTQTPEGFVPLTDLEREQARARTFQSELDRTKQELARLQAGSAAGNGGGSGEGQGGSTTEQGFDPDAFRANLLRDVFAADQMRQAAVDLKGQFPYADEALYGRLADFGSPDALRLAVEDSHNRVAALIGKEKESIEAKLREEYGRTVGGGGEGATGTGLPAGDPTLEQLNAMSMAELNELETKSPGVIERVLRSANS